MMSKVIDEEGMLEHAPLYLQTYLDGRETETQRAPRRDAKVVAHRGNVIEVDFRDGWDEPKLSVVFSASSKRLSSKRMLNGWWDAAILLLLIGSVIGSVLALLYK